MLLLEVVLLTNNLTLTTSNIRSTISHRSKDTMSINVLSLTDIIYAMSNNVASLF